MRGLSVIVATRNRPALLADCLRSLQVQNHVADIDMEIVVVDDGSDVDLEPVVSASAGPVPLQFIRQDHGGLSRARNRGTTEASGDVLAYIDDDAVAAPEWATAFFRTIREWGCEGAAGRINLALEGDAPRWLHGGIRTFYGELDLGDRARWLSDDEAPFGGNFALTRAAFELVDGFPLDLGYSGGRLTSNEDVAFARRLRSLGGRLVWCPKALIRHRVAADRLTRDFVLRRAFIQGRSDVLVDSMFGDPAPEPTVDLLRWARTAPILAKGVLLRRETVTAQVWWEYCRGRRQALKDVVPT